MMHEEYINTVLVTKTIFRLVYCTFLSKTQNWCITFASFVGKTYKAHKLQARRFGIEPHHCKASLCIISIITRMLTPQQPQQPNKNLHVNFMKPKY